MARARVPAAALAPIALALLVGIAFRLWPSGETDALANPPATAVAAPASSRPVATAPVAPTPAAPPGRSTGLASPAPAEHPTDTIGLTNQARQPIAQASQAGAPAVAPVHITATEGQLRVTSTPSGARVTVNGIGWGQTPLTVGHLPLGTKTVRLTHDGYASQQRIVELSGNGAAAALSVTLQHAR